MSYGTGQTIANMGRACQELCIVGAQLAVAGTKAAAIGAMSVVDGVLAIAELARGTSSDAPVAQGSAATFKVLPTGLVTEALPMFRTGLEARKIRFAEGGNLKLADGNDLSITYAALDERGQVLFFVRPAAEGYIELIVADRGKLPQVEGILEEVVAETVMALAMETLRQQGFGLSWREGNRWAMERRVKGDIREQVVFEYSGSRLDTFAVSIGPNGEHLQGNSCPDIRSFTDYLVAPEFYPLTGGAALRLPPFKRQPNKDDSVQTRNTSWNAGQSESR